LFRFIPKDINYRIIILTTIGYYFLYEAEFAWAETRYRRYGDS